MDKKLIEHKLDEYAAEAVPEGVDLWPRLAARVGRTAAQQARGDGAGRVRPARRAPGLVFAALATVLLVGVTSLALLLGQPAGGEQPGAGQDPTPLATATPQAPAVRPLVDTMLNISITHGAYTVVLHSAHADVNHVAVFYSLQGPEGENLAATDNMLKDFGSAESRLAPMFGYEDDPRGKSYAVMFAAPERALRVSELRLRLIVSIARVATTGGPPLLFPHLDASNAWITVAGEQTELSATGGKSMVRLGDEFVFDFTVPVANAGVRSATMNQTALAAGVPLTLEQVVVSTVTTRVILRYKPPDGQPWLPAITVHGGDFLSDAPANRDLTRMLRKLDGDRWRFDIFTDLSGKTSDWMLTVAEGQRGFDPGPPESTPGFWTFLFNMPPALK